MTSNVRKLGSIGLAAIAGLTWSLAADKESSKILIEGIDEWKVEPYGGNSLVRTFVPGDKTQTALSGVLVFDSQTNGFLAAGTSVAIVTPDGRADVLTGQPGVSGNTDGPPGRATFGNAIDIVRVSDTLLYVANAANFTLRKIERVDGVWQTDTVAGVPGVEGHRDGPVGKSMFMSVFDSLTADENGTVYLFDGDWLRRFDKGILTTLNPEGGTGYVNGPIRQARFAHSQGARHGLTCDGQGNLYVADKVNMAIRKVDLKRGDVSTFAGVLPGVKRTMTRDGKATEARFHPGGGPNVIFYDKTNNRFFCNSDDENAIRVILKDQDEWCVRTFLPGGICGLDDSGRVYMPSNGCIQVATNVKEGAR